MLHFTFSTKKIIDQKVHCLVFFVEQDFTFSKELKECANIFFPQLEQFIKSKKFTGKVLSRLLVPASLQNSVTSLLFIGLGKTDAQGRIDVETFRRALGHVIRIAEAEHFETFSFTVPSAKLFGKAKEYIAKQIAIILNMATYHFDQFITDDSCKLYHNFKITLITAEKEKKVIERGVKLGGFIAQAVNNARHWVDLPAASLTPVELAEHANQIAKKHKLKITVFDETKVNQIGMGGLAAVARGSDRDCRFVAMEYRSPKKNAQTIAFVGKGITFDSGGLSLKPADYMETMKDDMSGAAAVIATMDVLAKLKPNVNVIGLAGLAENLPSGKAMMPGDIITFYNGKTAEVKNTDAEGRLVLADVLSYAVKHYRPDAMIDLATLTGTCQYALGPFFSGLMSKHKDLAKKVEYAANLAGEHVWPLPFTDDYKPAIKSTVADISNIGSSKYKAGAITAGFFLQHFVGETPWVHLDIAGTAFDVPDISYYRTGATGVGVRLMVELAMNWH